MRARFSASCGVSADAGLTSSSASSCRPTVPSIEARAAGGASACAASQASAESASIGILPHRHRSRWRACNLGHRHPDPPAVAIDEADEDEGDERDGQQHGLGSRRPRRTARRRLPGRAGSRRRSSERAVLLRGARASTGTAGARSSAGTPRPPSSRPPRVPSSARASRRRLGSPPGPRRSSAGGR